MRRFWRENSLSVVVLGCFLIFLVAQTVAGYRDHSEDLREHGEAPITLAQYLGSGHYLEAVFENWESEFLQMGFYVLLTVFLRQKGSAESKKFPARRRWTRIRGNTATIRRLPAPCAGGDSSSRSTNTP